MEGDILRYTIQHSLPHMHTFLKCRTKAMPYIYGSTQECCIPEFAVSKCESSIASIPHGFCFLVEKKSPESITNEYLQLSSSVCIMCFERVINHISNYMKHEP